MAVAEVTRHQTARALVKAGYWQSDRLTTVRCASNCRHAANSHSTNRKHLYAYSTSLRGSVAVNFPIPDHPDVETLAEMVSRVLLPYSSELGLDATGGAQQPKRQVSGKSLERPSPEQSSQDSELH